MQILAATVGVLAVMLVFQLSGGLEAPAPTGEEANEPPPPLADITVRPLEFEGVSRLPTWGELFRAYDIETEIRDASILCAVDGDAQAAQAQVDRQLAEGQVVRVYLREDPNCGSPAPPPRR